MSEIKIIKGWSLRSALFVLTHQTKELQIVRERVMPDGTVVKYKRAYDYECVFEPRWWWKLLGGK